MNEPFKYVALVGSSFVEADDNLNDLLRAVRQLHDRETGEDVVIWRDGKRIAAVVHHDGSETIYEPMEGSRNFALDIARAIVKRADKSK
jgi:antitoxin (DNA-binding transcriptional repressor) of toxin-antitoxin stability system